MMNWKKKLLKQRTDLKEHSSNLKKVNSEIRNKEYTIRREVEKKLRIKGSEYNKLVESISKLAKIKHKLDEEVVSVRCEVDDLENTVKKEIERYYKEKKLDIEEEFKEREHEIKEQRKKLSDLNFKVDMANRKAKSVAEEHFNKLINDFSKTLSPTLKGYFQDFGAEQITLDIPKDFNIFSLI